MRPIFEQQYGVFFWGVSENLGNLDIDANFHRKKPVLEFLTVKKPGVFKLFERAKAKNKGKTESPQPRPHWYLIYEIYTTNKQYVVANFSEYP